MKLNIFAKGNILSTANNFLEMQWKDEKLGGITPFEFY